MAIKYIQHTYFFFLLTLLFGQGDGQWKKYPRDVLQRDIKLYKKMTEKLKQEFEDYYSDYSNEPINDYFLEEIDYVQSKIEKHIRPKLKDETGKETSYFRVNFSEEDHRIRSPYTKEYVTDTSSKNVDENSFKGSIVTNGSWPKFEDILLAIGKQYDWKNDRWIKVKAKMKEKQRFNQLESSEDHRKHNFRYRIVKLNRAKSKRKVVIAVTAVR